ncbi:conserved hypothetical membrane protein [Thiobacillus denitrificans ATCC 25259]|uniref:Conserved hypothetical membrane protein n=1 Tax=Thiobacillus denitrificans (strain ATCC 25259 / T1) TaxID=292415 RepID=Q3SJK3_THIDA|nr:DUF6064 family protein [Thiobacillus denitrificans]AAZ97154.1 conserved hypothetical membrane protein [Thiobacillus denitrificans ATCC 25259]
MSEWWTYGLRDLLLFSPQAYYRLFELHNLAWWPLPLVMLGLGVLTLALALHGGARAVRAAALIHAACWIWVAWAFHGERYAAINPAAAYFAWAFALQGVLLLGLQRAKLAPAGALQRRVGIGLLVFALLGLPLAGPLFGRSWAGAEVFGMAPDPTAVATLGVLLLVEARRLWGLYVIPLAWCGVSGATLWALDAPEFVVLPLAGVLALVVARRGA